MTTSLEDCVLFASGIPPRIVHVPRDTPYLDLFNEQTLRIERYRFFTVTKGRGTENPDYFCIAGLNDPFDEWDVWRYISELGPKPLGSN